MSPASEHAPGRDYCAFVDAVGVLAVLAHKITLPYPIVLVLGGLALSFVPRLPAVNLNPDVVFYFPNYM